MKRIKVIISGGGTGGHIYPALAIANEIKDRFQDAEILFVGALGKMEMQKVPAAGFQIVGLPVIGFPRKPGLKMVDFFIRLVKSVMKARKIVDDFKPDVAIGVGGFASGPVLHAATRKGIPALIQEQNSYAGITNKLLGKRVDKICVAYEKMERFFPAGKIVLTGNPVRKGLLADIAGVEEPRAFFGLEPEDKVILIIGGSLGARSVNDAVINNLEAIRNSGVQVIWQTGAYYFEEMKKRTSGNKPGNLHIHRFINRMDLAYAACNLVISRAGAGTISELCMVGKPSILVPSPNVAEGHQAKNALALVEQEASVLIEDSEIGEKLFPGAFALVNNPERLLVLAKNCKKLARANATEDIVNEVVRLIE
ncbi:UDP-N-acetylglucosamine--N-acetylmuramyl-(pentapeptide) pyrophosphoryl-undecaprenol N-acetylglucosamine transferase [hydrothermal vent metagenome]|uniref:UDP-N-acetylglucosamine--N-acetylmuramyl-(Pentapeptide) pyrophosphoryl-undecaprenol N-acetylglucosamine transferase n=1 Tax=hydrothermal vent metagenome TaxID=652676 RepID=A0A3B0TGJ5_9ZZZZ